MLAIATMRHFNTCCCHGLSVECFGSKQVHLVFALSIASGPGATMQDTVINMPVSLGQCMG